VITPEVKPKESPVFNDSLIFDSINFESSFIDASIIRKIEPRIAKMRD
jgi:hypothetical protein